MPCVVTHYPVEIWLMVNAECMGGPWVLTSARYGTGCLVYQQYFTCRNCGGGDRGRVAIYRPFGEVSLSLNRTVTCMVLKANDRRTSCPCHDEFRGPRSDYVRQHKTSNLSNFQAGQTVGARLAEASVTETFHVLRVSTGTVSNDMTARTQRDKTNSRKENIGCKEKLCERDELVMRCIVMSKMQPTFAKVTPELNQHLDCPVPIITVRKHVH
ncbi:uncharacterized protein TNCV_950361 [Trichonephila clavipes]|nr:uncharacterized protein TNCV_950361 [Trichonephila clavipes]